MLCNIFQKKRIKSNNDNNNDITDGLPIVDKSHDVSYLEKIGSYHQIPKAKKVQFSQRKNETLKHKVRKVFSIIKGIVMQVEIKTLINDHLHASKASSKFRIPTVYNYAVIFP